MFGLKQEGLAYELGEEWNQKRVSLLEAKEEIDDSVLDLIAKALKVPAEALKNFDEHAAINIVSSTLHDNAGSVNNSYLLSAPLKNGLKQWREIKNYIPLC